MSLSKFQIFAQNIRSIEIYNLDEITDEELYNN